MKNVINYIGYQFRSELSLQPILFVNALLVFVSVYIANVLLPDLHTLDIWLILFWIITFLAVAGAFMTSFRYELGLGHFLMYQLLSSEEVFLSKVFFNCIKSFILHCVVFLSLQLFFPRPELLGDTSWWLIVVMSSVGQAVALTLVAALAEKTHQAGVLYSVLGLPILMSQVWLVSGSSRRILIEGEGLSSFLQMTTAVSIVLFCASLFLFSYLWNE